MADENLTRITELCAAFKEAVEALPEIQDPALVEKVLESLKPGEQEKAQELAEAVVAESLSLVFGGEPSDDFLKKNIGLCEITADIFSRVIAEEKIAACVPAGLKNAADAQALRGLGAPKLASLCSPK
jgi:hypothetical protein